MIDVDRGLYVTAHVDHDDADRVVLVIGAGRRPFFADIAVTLDTDDARLIAAEIMSAVEKIEKSSMTTDDVVAETEGRR